MKNNFTSASNKTKTIVKFNILLTPDTETTALLITNDSELDNRQLILLSYFLKCQHSNMVGLTTDIYNIDRKKMQVNDA